MTASGAAASTYGAVGVGSLYQRSGQVSPSSAGTPTYATVVRSIRRPKYCTPSGQS
ncbi:hypothetical protein [Streptomyces puniciscabiei]|uniref:hypothetical protein n=1 Tax=Streptomyces puniciscabiei TaxID=164348 RepID=UPI0037B06116